MPEPLPAGGPAGALSVGDALGYGWKAFQRYLGPLLVLTLVVLAVQLVLSVAGYGVDSWPLRIMINLLTTVVGLIVALGLIRAALAVLDGRAPEVGMLFQTDGLVPYVVASVLVGISVGVGLVLCILPGLVLGFLFQFYGYAIVDARAADGIEAMKQSWQLVSANVAPLLLLVLALIGINILGALVCFIGLLVTYPVTAVALAYAWRRISGGVVAPVA